jgi:hypothetical protein
MFLPNISVRGRSIFTRIVVDQFPESTIYVDDFEAGLQSTIDTII